MTSLTKFFKGLQVEWSHIVWPAQRTVALFTVVVIVITFAVAYYLGALDLLFSEVLSLIL
jgi:preprotein translocase SecE subunit